MHNQDYLLNLLDYNSWANEEFFKVIIKLTLDEIQKQYVITARSKGLKEKEILYGHVFSNAMLIVIAGFPAVFIGVFFGGSLIIATIFSLDGLGRMGFEAAVARDYPVIFGTLFVFGLIGLTV